MGVGMVAGRPAESSANISAQPSSTTSAVQLPPQNLTVLGSTGSIGVNTLDVIARHPSLSVYALTAGRNDALLLEQCLAFSPEVAVMADAAAAERLQAALHEAGSSTRVEQGEDALAAVASSERVDTVMAAIVGAAGMRPALAAANAGKKVLLANKEALVMTGELFMQAAQQSGATVLPIDSEHNAIFQCLPATGQAERGSDLRAQGVRRVVLTASGGPFLHADPQTLASVTPAQACNHPNWSMGRKISVDSATMMNKGLEYIEACYLFALQPAQVDVVIHPQSIVHSMVEYHDGSVLAQMGSPDMRVPIAHALAWPQRVDSGASFLDLATSPDLQFYQPDLERFPCLGLGIEAARQGGYAPTILNAANEVAVAAFLDETLRFTDIARVVSATLERITCTEPLSLAMIQQVDEEARTVATGLVSKHRF